MPAGISIAAVPFRQESRRAEPRRTMTASGNFSDSKSPERSIASTEEIIEEARAGRMFLLVDDEDRENEGDLVVPAEFAGPEQINFMSKYCCGLICLALPRERSELLGLQPMVPNNQSRYQTAFTVSIEARTGVETGISAHDRARTIAVAIASEATPDDIVSPGHVFPLVARDGGTLVRAGHTEAAVDVARLAGLLPYAVICEVLKEDGTMARLPDLVKFSRRHGLKVATIADLIAYRRRRERLVELVRRGEVTDGEGRSWTLSIFRDLVDGKDHLALTRGDVGRPGPVLVRMHAEDVIEQFLVTERSKLLSVALDRVAAAERGAVVLIRGAKPLPLAVEARFRQSGGPILKDYGIGAQILLELGIREIELLSTRPKSIVGLEGFGLRVTEHKQL
jgi:3,4-dihydroxy 2-butanone 4-phosphate synthase / GTP cyclohydrolase II